tara:strand:+ start:598 stop:837 length:240 start_codon:yes stop_codon:yes gene_type:complete
VQRAAEEAALQNAVTNAVKLRRQLGAFTGAVEAKSFSLPNPGVAPGSECQPWLLRLLRARLAALGGATLSAEEVGSLGG